MYVSLLTIQYWIRQYQTIKSVGDTITMEFNVSKCHISTLTDINYLIVAIGIKLCVNSVKYILNSQTIWKRATHIRGIVSKANKTNVFLRRNLKGCSTPTLIACYKTFVRPLLEYYNTGWDPYQTKLASQIETFQTRSIKHFKKCCHYEESAFISKFDLELLQNRRKREKATLMSKITIALLIFH